MKFKKLLSRYGLVFAGTYVLSFFLLITFYPKFNFPTLPGDVLIKRVGLVVYIPIVSSLAFATFVTVMLEIYKVFKQ